LDIKKLKSQQQQQQAIVTKQISEELHHKYVKYASQILLFSPSREKKGSA